MNIFNGSLSGSTSNYDVAQDAVINGKLDQLTDSGSGNSLIANAETGKIKKLIAGSGVSISSAADALTLSAIGGGGGIVQAVDVVYNVNSNVSTTLDNLISNDGILTNAIIAAGNNLSTHLSDTTAHDSAHINRVANASGIGGASVELALVDLKNQIDNVNAGASFTNTELDSIKNIDNNGSTSTTAVSHTTWNRLKDLPNIYASTGGFSAWSLDANGLRYYNDGLTTSFDSAFINTSIGNHYSSSQPAIVINGTNKAGSNFAFGVKRPGRGQGNALFSDYAIVGYHSAALTGRNESNQEVWKLYENGTAKFAGGLIYDGNDNVLNSLITTGSGLKLSKTLAADGTKNSDIFTTLNNSLCLSNKGYNLSTGVGSAVLNESILIGAGFSAGGSTVGVGITNSIVIGNNQTLRSCSNTIALLLGDSPSTVPNNSVILGKFNGGNSCIGIMQFAADQSHSLVNSQYSITLGNACSMSGGTSHYSLNLGYSSRIHGNSPSTQSTGCISFGNNNSVNYNNNNSIEPSNCIVIGENNHAARETFSTPYSGAYTDITLIGQNNKTSGRYNAIFGYNNVIDDMTGTFTHEHIYILGSNWAPTNADLRMQNTNVVMLGDAAHTNQMQLFIGSANGLYNHQNASFADLVINTTNSVQARQWSITMVSSARKYKENIRTFEDYDDFDEKFKSLVPVRYTRKGNDSAADEFGFIADDVAFPEVVIHNNSNEVESLQYSRLCVILCEKIRRLEQRVRVLENN